MAGIGNFIFTVLDLNVALVLGLVTGASFFWVVRLTYTRILVLIETLSTGFVAAELSEVYKNAILPYREWFSWTFALIVLDLLILATPTPRWLVALESPIGLAIAIAITLLGFRIFESFFDDYFLESIFGGRQKIDSELLALIKVLVKFAFVLIIVFIFAETHKINVLGLVASLGVGGVALAFASQRVLEQILWSITLYIDRPFDVDDYLHLPDGTIGKVEATGWRSTKIRLSGKNTLVIAPNSNLAQVNIENLTRARRAISIVNLAFARLMSDEEKALVHQLILESTSDILGIDRTLTQISFETHASDTGKLEVRGQAVFFVLGAAGSSMNLRRSLLEIARDNIIERLDAYGIECRVREDTLDVTQPMNF